MWACQGFMSLCMGAVYAIPAVSLSAATHARLFVSRGVDTLGHHEFPCAAAGVCLAVRPGRMVTGNRGAVVRPEERHRPPDRARRRRNAVPDRRADQGT